MSYAELNYDGNLQKYIDLTCKALIDMTMQKKITFFELLFYTSEGKHQISSNQTAKLFESRFLYDLFLLMMDSKREKN
jgi:hypothetical protein